MKTVKQVWFAAANSERGFENRFPALFRAEAGVKRLYIIKGGPGTGKNRLMRRVADSAEARGWHAVRFLCSSDPDSLDGLWLTSPAGGRVGLLDGTAPHAWEPTLPGAREDLLDLGRFWDSAGLAREQESIGRLNLRKSAAYRRAYHCLRAAGEADRVGESLLAPCLREVKLDALTDRLLRMAVRRGQAAEPLPLPTEVFRRGYTMSGLMRLDTPDRLSAKLLCIGESTGVGYRLLHLLRHRAAERHIPITVFCDPLRPDRIDGLLFHESRLCVLGDAPAAGRPEADPHPLSLRSCLDSEVLRLVRPQMRAAAALRDSALENAVVHLSSAREAHFELERIYTAAMDFEAVEAFTREVCERVLG